MSDDAHTPGGLADSAGIAWAGREFHENGAAGDDGSADPRLLEAVRRFRLREVDASEVVEALGQARLLVPLVAVAGHDGIGPFGQRVDKTQELALVTLESPDGRAVQPVFSSVAAMAAWNPQARPVPAEAPRVALAAADEGTELVVLDPRSPTEFVVRRTAFRALATGERWTPCYLDEAVLDAFLASVAPEPVVYSVQLAPGDPDARLNGPELLVQLGLEPGLTRKDIDALLERLDERWAVDELIAERVDSIALKLDKI